MGTNSQATSLPRTARALVAFLGLSLVLAISGTVAPARAQDSSPEAALASPVLGTLDGPSLCDSAERVRLIVGFLRETSISEDGLVPVVVGVIAGLSEARTLAGLVDATYRPLVDELSGSLQGLQSAVQERGEQPTVGAQIASIGEAITAVGNAMDALSVELRTPCPVEPMPSLAPVE